MSRNNIINALKNLERVYNISAEFCRRDPSYQPWQLDEVQRARRAVASSIEDYSDVELLLDLLEKPEDA